MIKISTDQVDKLLGDIASIKSVLSKNKPVLKQLLLPMHFRVISFIGGAAIVVLAAVYYYLLLWHGDYDRIPERIRYLLIGVIAFLFLLVLFLKRALWVRSVQRLDKRYTFGEIVKNIYTYQFTHIWLPITLIMLFLIGYLCYVDAERLIITVVSVGIGLLYNSIGGMTRIRQYLIVGYWLIVTGLLNLVLVELSAFVFLALSPGCGLLLFAFISGESGSDAGEE
jgi:hypothetical protein